MRCRAFIARRPILSACMLFLIASLALLTGTGAFLAANPSVGGWTGPSSPGRGASMATCGHNELVRTPDGVRLGRSVIAPDIAPSSPQGTPLGTVKFQMHVANLGGWPRPTHQRWTVSVDSIVPAAGGPPAQDERGWRALVAQALAATPTFSFGGWGDVPAKALAGEADFEEWRWRAFLKNPVLRLRHAPLWAAASIALAAVMALIGGVLLWRRRHRPGACRRCGYDLAGLRDRVCPECGAAIA